MRVSHCHLLLAAGDATVSAKPGAGGRVRWRVGRRDWVGANGGAPAVAAKDAARAALVDRFPDVARADDVSVGSPVMPSHGWVPVEGGRGEFRVFDERVSAMVAPGPSGRWQAWATVDGTPRQGPLAGDVDAAKTTAVSLARGGLLELATYTPDRANALVHDLATSDVWDRSQVVAIVGPRLSDVERAELATTTHRPTGAISETSLRTRHILSRSKLNVHGPGQFGRQSQQQTPASHSAPTGQISTPPRDSEHTECKCSLI